MTYTLRTAVFSGGSAFDLRLPGNPVVSHRGGTTVVHLLLTDEMADWISRSLSESHPGVQVELRAVVGQTSEQQAEREVLLGVGQQDRVWPTAKCPSCFWFDPLVEEACGFVGWPEVRRTPSFDHPAASRALADCPIRHA